MVDSVDWPMGISNDTKAIEYNECNIIDRNVARSIVRNVDSKLKIRLILIGNYVPSLIIRKSKLIHIFREKNMPQYDYSTS